jgi:hypothetical protein
MGEMKMGVTYTGLPAGHVVIEGGQPAQSWLLGVLGSFARLQDEVQHQLTMYIYNKSAEHVALTLERCHFSRLTDAERWGYIKSLAKDVGFTGDLNRASDAFWRCKRVRDVIGHSESLELWFDPTIQAYTYLSGAKRLKGVPDPLTPAVLRMIEAETRWLWSLVRHLGYLGGVTYVSVGFHRHDDGKLHAPALEIPDPGPLPTDPDWQAPEARPLPCETGGLMGVERPQSQVPAT